MSTSFTYPVIYSEMRMTSILQLIKQNKVQIAITAGLSLLLLAAVVNMQGINTMFANASGGIQEAYMYPSANQDIANQDGSSVSIGGESVWVGTGLNTAQSFLGIRFNTASITSIPAGATLLSVALELCSTADQPTATDYEVGVEKVANAQPYSSTNPPSQRVLTTSKVRDTSSLGWEKNKCYRLDITNSMVDMLKSVPAPVNVNVILKGMSPNVSSRKFIHTKLTDKAMLPKLVVRLQLAANPTSTTTSTPVPPPVNPPVPVEPVPVPIPGAPVVPVIYVSPSGQDTNPGTKDSPLRSIQAGINKVKLGGQVAKYEIRLLPGEYREGVVIDSVRNVSEELKILADQPGTVSVLGSELINKGWQRTNNGMPFSASALANVYAVNIAALNTEPEVVYWRGSNTPTLLPKAQEPDVQLFSAKGIDDPRWQASGRIGDDSYTTLVDSTNDQGALPGNLTLINGFSESFLKGARLFAKDGYSGHDMGTAIITDHNPAQASIAFDRRLSYFTGAPLVTNLTKYMVEGKPQLLDQPGEWYYDKDSKFLYVWPLDPNNIAVEVGVRNTVFRIRNSLNISLVDLNLHYSNYKFGRSYGDEGAVYIGNNSQHSTRNIKLQNLTISHNGVGVRINQDTGQNNLTQQIYIQNSKITYNHGLGIMVFQWPYKDQVDKYIPGVKDVYIQNNEIAYNSYRPAWFMVWIQHAQNIVFQNNYFHHSAHNAVEVQGGYETNMLVTNNLFSDNCMDGADCAGFKVWAARTSMRNVLIANNIAQSTKGCSFASAQTGRWGSSGGVGCGGFGLYSDVVRSYQPGEIAVIYFHNLVRNNTNSGLNLTRTQEQGVFNNQFWQNPYGIRVNSASGKEERGFGSKFQYNQFYRSLPAGAFSDYGLLLSYADISDLDRVLVDNNTYLTQGEKTYLVGTRSLSTNKVQSYPNINDVKAVTPWEDNGSTATSAFVTLNTNSKGGELSLVSAAQQQIINEVGWMIERLEAKLGIKIELNSWVGIKP